jgi:general secretion pathway protein A
MYAAYFGLKENPFSLSPEPRYLFLSEQHRDALNCLIYGIKEKKGFVLISGDIGTGKLQFAAACSALWMIPWKQR